MSFLLALVSLGAWAQVFPDSAADVEGTAASGSLASLYAVDGNAYVKTTLPDTAGNGVASFDASFPIPVNQPSAIFHAVVGANVSGCVVQAYVHDASNNDFLGFQSVPSGTSTVEFPITGGQLAQYRNAASGETVIRIRVYRPPSAGTGAVTWSTDQSAVLLPILPDGGFDYEGTYQSGSLASLFAVDGDRYVRTTLPDGSGNEVASYYRTFRIPDGAPSAILHYVTGTSVDGAVLQAYAITPNVGGDYLGYAPMPNGQGPVDFGVTATELARKDPTTGEFTAMLRMFRPPAAGSGTVTWSTDQVVMYALPSPGPAMPTALTASAVSASEIDLSWTDNANNETGYKIERKTGANGTYAQIGTAPANATAYQDTDGGNRLAASTTYYYRVRAQDADGNSPYSNEASATTLSPPPARLASIALDRHNTLGSRQPITATIALTYAATSPTTVTLHSNDNDVTIPGSIIVPTGQRTASVNVTYSATPYPQTRAVTLSAYSGIWAQQDEMEVLNPQASIAIANFGAEGGDGVVAITWDPLPDHTYERRRVERRTIDASNGQVLATASFTTSGTTFYDFTAINGSTYDYRLAVDAEGDETPPAATSWVRVSPQSSNTILSWVNQPPATPSGPTTVGASLSSGATKGIILVVDGQSVGFQGVGEESAAVSSASISYDFGALAFGTHKVRLVASANGTTVATPEATVQIAGSSFSLQADDTFEWGVGELNSIKLRVPSGTYDWQITVVNDAGQTMRTWSGDGGEPAVLSWDGSDSTQQAGTRGSFTVKGKVNGPGGTQGGTVDVTSVDRDPTALFLVSAVTTGAPQKDIEYANFLKDVCRRMEINDSQFHGLVLYGSKTTAKTYNAIRRWMGSSLDTFYLGGHGAPSRDMLSDSSNIPFRHGEFSSWADLVFTPSDRIDPRVLTHYYGKSGKQVVVRSTVRNRYKFVWMDTCNSGGADTSAPIVNGEGSSAIGRSSQAFDVAFGTFNQDDRVCITWNGFDILNYVLENGNMTGWGYWRRDLWNKFVGGMSLEQALVQGSLRQQLNYGVQYPFSPYDTRNISGDPYWSGGLVPRLNRSSDGKLIHD